MREAEILTLVAEGSSNYAISLEMRISVYTVKEHLTRIFRKTKTGNRLTAALWALKATERDRYRAAFRHLPRSVVPVRPPDGQTRSFEKKRASEG